MIGKRKNDVMVEDWEVNDISHPRAGAETCIKERKMKKEDFPGAI